MIYLYLDCHIFHSQNEIQKIEKNSIIDPGVIIIFL